MPPGDDDRRAKQVRFAADAWSMAFFFPAAIGGGVLLGWWLDKTFGTRPWLMIVFGACGVAAAFVQLFRIGMRDDGSGP